MNEIFSLSIVTVVYNGGDALEKTIQSVVKYKSSQIEYIIVDGKSTDNTVQIINKYINFIDCFISEPDQGIYDAMNKGIKTASGLYVLNLNVGDELLNSPLKYINKNTLKQQYDLILFDVLLSSNKIFHGVISSKLRISNTIHHQGALYLRNPNQLYDLAYKVFSDFDYNQRLYVKKDFTFLKINKSISYHDLGGISHCKDHFFENFKIIRKNFNALFSAIAFVYYKYMGLKLRIKR